MKFIFLCVFSANGPIMNRQPVSVGPVPTATVKVVSLFDLFSQLEEVTA